MEIKLFLYMKNIYKGIVAIFPLFFVKLWQ